MTDEVPNYHAIFKKLSPERQREILKTVLGPETRELEGEEKDHLWLILQFMDPSWVSNNQQFSSAHYVYNGFIYHVHYIGEHLMIEEEVAED